MPNKKALTVLWDKEASEDDERLRRIAEHRRELSRIFMKGRRYLRPGEESWIGETFEHSLIVEPDGAGLPCVIQSAREMCVHIERIPL